MLQYMYICFEFLCNMWQLLTSECCPHIYSRIRFLQLTNTKPDFNFQGTGRPTLPVTLFTSSAALPSADAQIVTITLRQQPFIWFFIFISLDPEHDQKCLIRVHLLRKHIPSHNKCCLCLWGVLWNVAFRVLLTSMSHRCCLYQEMLIIPNISGEDKHVLRRWWQYHFWLHGCGRYIIKIDMFFAVLCGANSWVSVSPVTWESCHTHTHDGCDW